MERLETADVRRLLDFVQTVGTVEGPDPFPQGILDSLVELIACSDVTYFEWHGGVLVDHVASGDLEMPLAVAEALRVLGREMPTAARHLSPADGAVALSDRISRRELVRSEFYREVMRPIEVEDELKVRLATDSSRIAGFSFLRDSRFTERDRLVLDLLTPYLSRRHDRAAAPMFVRVEGDLSEREWEVLAWVARGKTSKEVATLLLIRPSTVRKHLEHIFEKLGVHTRTGAVARAFRISQS